MYERPSARGGSVNLRSFCFSLKFALIERYKVLIQLERMVVNKMCKTFNTAKVGTNLSVEFVIKFLPGCGHAGQSTESEPEVRLSSLLAMLAPPP